MSIYGPWRTIHPSRVKVGDRIKLQRWRAKTETVERVSTSIGMHWFDTEGWTVGRRTKVRASLKHPRP